MDIKEKVLKKHGIMILETTEHNIILENKGKTIKYMKYCYENWHYSYILSDVIFKFNLLGVKIELILIDEFIEKKKNIRKLLSI